MTAWVLYAALVSVLLGAAAWLLEQGFRAWRWPTRLPWAGALLGALLIPLLGQPGSVNLEYVDEAPIPAGGLSASSAPVSSTPTVPWMDVVVVVGWVGLSLACLLGIAATLMVIGRARRRWTSARAGRHDVLVSGAFGPALVGLTRPAIVLPRWARDLGFEPAAVMAEHEHEHRKAGDHVLLLGAALVVALIPWNPVAWWIQRRLRGAVEVDCDQRTLAAGVSLEAYGSTLLEVSRNSPGRIWNLAPGLIEPKSQLERRLTMMGRGRIQLTRPALASLLAGAVVLVAVACETPAPTDLQDAYSRVASLRSDAEGQGTYVLEGMSSAGDTVFIMGRTLVYTGSDPLVFINGRLLEPEQLADRNQILADLDPEGVERVEVVKGDAAARLGGPRAARGGAIFIFLKDGVEIEGLDLTGPSAVELEAASARAEAEADRAVEAAERARRELSAASARSLGDATVGEVQELQEAAERYYAAEIREGQARDRLSELDAGKLRARLEEQAATLERLSRSGEASTEELAELRARLVADQRRAEESLRGLNEERADELSQRQTEIAQASREATLRRAEALMAEAEALMADAVREPASVSARSLERLVRLQAAIQQEADGLNLDEGRMKEALRRLGDMLKELQVRFKQRPGGMD